MENREIPKNKTTFEKPISQTRGEQKTSRLDQINQELKTFNIAVKSPEERRQTGNERGRKFQRKIDELESTLGRLGKNSKELVYKNIVDDDIEHALRDNKRFDELQREKSSLEGKESTESDAFDPDEELKKVSEFTEEEMKDTTSKERLAIKRVRLEEYKKMLAEQKIGIAKLNAELENKILSSENVNRKDLEEYILNQAGDCKLSKNQLEKYRSVLDKIEKRNSTIREFAQKYKGKDEEFFEALFGRKPLGTVNIEASSISFVVSCKDKRDYAWVWNAKFMEPGSADANDDELRETESSHGHANEIFVKIPELTHSVVTINESLIASHYSEPNKKIKEIADHEVKHIANRIINGEFQELSSAQRGLSGNEASAMDEILSFMKSNDSIEGIRRNLLGNEAYGYFERDRARFEEMKKGFISDTKISEESRGNILKMLDSELRKIEQDEKKFKNHIEKALDVVAKLEKIGFSREEMIGLLQTERLNQWSKAFERIKNSDDFKGKKAEPVAKINERIKEVEDSMKIIKGEIREVEEYREVEKNRSPLSKFMRAIFRKPEESILRRKKPDLLREQLASNEESLEKLLKQKEDIERM